MSTVLGKNSIIGFGKHAGKTIKWIWENQPKYIVWLDENVTTISIDQYIVKECTDIISDTYVDFDFGDNN